jgi:hypothetical protein
MSARLEAPEPWFRPDPPLAVLLAREAEAEIGADHELARHALESAMDNHQH